MWKKRQNGECIHVVTGISNNSPRLDSVFPSTVDFHPILYFQLDKKAIYLNLVKGPVTINSPLLEKPISDENIFDALTKLDKEINLKISRNKDTLKFELSLILETVSIDQNGMSILNFVTDKGSISLEIPNGEVTIWYNPTLPTEAIKGKNIVVAFKRFHRRIGYKRKS
jgi:hypothetical protein